MAINFSNFANLILFVAKVYASVASRSMAVIASTLDSFLDLLSGLILLVTSRAMSKPNQYSYPIGKKRMQPVVSKLKNIYQNALIPFSTCLLILIHLSGNNSVCISNGDTRLSSNIRVRSPNPRAIATEH